MDAKDLALLMTELKNGGPSPFVPGVEVPMAVLFRNELEMLAGEARTAVFGQPQIVSVIVTTFRLILYLKQPGGKDMCRSYWYKVDFGPWRWAQPDGFVISGLETSDLEFGQYPADGTYGPTASWTTFLVSPKGNREPLEEVVIYLTRYNYHQQMRFAPWNEFIALGDAEKQPAAVYFGYKLRLGADTPGTASLESLWRLMENPLQVENVDGGVVPPESRMHVSKATRTSESVEVTRVDKGRTGPKPKAGKAKEVAKTTIEVGSKVMEGLDEAQEVASLLTGGAALAGLGGLSAAIRVGRKVMGGLNTAQKAASMAAKGAAAVKSASKKGKAPSIGLKCPKCGASLSSGARFCGRCGQRIAQDLPDGESEAKIKKEGDQAGDAMERQVSPDASPEAMRAGMAKASGEPLKADGTGLSEVSAAEHARPLDRPEVKADARAEATALSCLGCGRSLQPSWKYCPYCKRRVEPACPECHKPVEPEWRFCPHCTAKL